MAKRMRTEGLGMVSVREILRLREQGLSGNRIAQSVNVSRSVVQNYLRLATVSGLTYEQACANVSRYYNETFSEVLRLLVQLPEWTDHILEEEDGLRMRQACGTLALQRMKNIVYSLFDLNSLKLSKAGSNPLPFIFSSSIWRELALARRATGGSTRASLFSSC